VVRYQAALHPVTFNAFSTLALNSYYSQIKYFWFLDNFKYIRCKQLPHYLFMSFMNNGNIISVVKVFADVVAKVSSGRSC
jgi:hypothetical protein